MVETHSPRFAERLRLAISERRHGPAFPVLPWVAAVTVVVGLFAVAAVIVVPPGEAQAFNFVDERGAVTALSAVFLAMGCAFSLVSLCTTHRWDTQRWFWLLMTLAVGFLALDELLMFHERLGGMLDRIDLMGASRGGPFRLWNDIIVISYGLLALPFAIMFLPTILRYPRLLELIGVGCGFYVIHTAIDSLVEPPTTMSVMFEESAKLFCSAYIAMGLFAGVLTCVRKRPDREAEHETT